MDIEKLNAFIKGLIDTHGDIDTVQKVVGNSTVLAEKFLIENPDCDISRQALSTMIFNRINNPSSLFETKEENEIDVNVTEKERYKFIGNTYVWGSKRAGSMKITLDQADAIFKAYSKYGEDLFSLEKIEYKTKDKTDFNDLNLGLDTKELKKVSLNLTVLLRKFYGYTYLIHKLHLMIVQAAL